MPPQSTRHAPPRTTPPPTRSAPPCRPTAGSSRRPPTALSFVDDRSLRYPATQALHCAPRPRSPFIAFPGHAGRSWPLLGWRLVVRIGPSVAPRRSHRSFGGASSLASVQNVSMTDTVRDHPALERLRRLDELLDRGPDPAPASDLGGERSTSRSGRPEVRKSGPRRPDRPLRPGSRRDAGDALDGLPAGARRPARPVGDRRDLLPRRVLVDARRVLRRRGVLRRVRLPDHVAAPRRARSHRRHQPPSVLAAPRPTPAAGSVHRARRRRRVVDLRRHRRAAVAAAARPAVGDLLRRQLGPDRRRRAVLQRRPAAAAPRVEPRRRGTVVPVLAAGVRRSPTHPADEVRHGRRCSSPSRWR